MGISNNSGITLLENVTSINGVSGDVTLVAGSNITITPSGENITIASTGGGTPAGSNGQPQYNNAGAFGAMDNHFYNSEFKFLGVNNTSPEGFIHVKQSDVISFACPNPTGDAFLSATTGSWWGDTGNNFQVYVYAYRDFFFGRVYSSSYLYNTYTDDGTFSVTYDLLLELTDGIPAGADGLRAFFYWYDPNVDTLYWNFNYFQDLPTLSETITTSSVTLGSATSATYTQRTITENLAHYYKNSTVRFMDASDVTKAIWDSTNNRLGVGTATPTELVHVKGVATTSPPNPSGSLIADIIYGQESYYSDSTPARFYFAFTYKLVNGKYILSTTHLTGAAYPDPESNYGVAVSLSNAVPSGADGYLVFGSTASSLPVLNLTAYWICNASGFNDAESSQLIGNVQASTAVGTLLLDDANIEFRYNGNTALFYSPSKGAFDTLKIAPSSSALPAFTIDTPTGFVNSAIRITSPSALLFSVSNTGAIQTNAGITASGTISTTSAISASASITGGSFSTSGTLGVSGTTTSRTTNITALNAATVPLTVRAAASHTANIQSWLNSAGTVLAGIASNGTLVFNDVDSGLAAGANGIRIITTTAGRGAGVQMGNAITGTSSVWQFFAKGGIIDFVIGRNGLRDNMILSGDQASVFFPGPNTGSSFAAGSYTLMASAGTSASFVPIIARGASSQTANLQEWQNSGATMLTRVGANGVYYPVQATTAGAPTYVLGGMYFDTTLNKLRIGGATGWETVTSV
jgi:hypothetical protein